MECLLILLSLSIQAEEAKTPYSAIAKGLTWAGIAVEEQDYTIWGASPILDNNGKVHLFVARWPEKNVNPAWRKSSEIAHYVSEKPEGPFHYVETVLKGSGMSGHWDAFAPHNPEIKKFGDTYALLYVANSDYHQPPHPLNQRIGMIVSKSLNGPWNKVGSDGLILKSSDDPTHWTHAKQVVNPAIVRVKNQFYLYFKSRYKNGTGFGLAVSDRLEGPYRMEKKPLTTEGVFIEDAAVFKWNEKICLLTTDNRGHVTGIPGGGALWISDDGRYFNPEHVQVGFDRIPAYYEDVPLSKIKKIYGSAPKFERPKILMIDGKPSFMYAPSGWAVHGGQRTACYVLSINLSGSAKSTFNKSH